MKRTKTLVALMDHAASVYPREFTGYELIKERGMFSGTLYPLVRRLEREGFLAKRFEDKEGDDDGRPARKFLSLTEKGRRLAIEVLDEVSLGYATVSRSREKMETGQ